MNKLDIVKGGIQLASSIGAGIIVTNVVKYTTPSDLKTIKRLCVNVGSFMLGSLISDKVSDYAGNMVEEMAKILKDFVDNFGPASPENRGSDE